ncbi:hypothetical protein OE88DRAFT_1658834 [Heliocybe sulcata]|uniref:GmrSD restriction endonucleases N-terminal domain-containing protein n=1 Tax=Heliocybe sulcata TaxID=5364 RepID=A0A5C3N5D5_9AGAM|nr:hypothetical protein OE88DRAFT_1658834 [Heliocybe sulcata]
MSEIEPQVQGAGEAEDEWDEAEDENPLVMKIRDPLQPAEKKELTTKELHTMIHDGLIDLNPPYQRDVVWPENKQMRLIDSIFRDFYVPPIVFMVTRDEEDENVRTCVDGKQRLTSIQKFIDGQIPHRDSLTGKCFWYTCPQSLRAQRLEVPNDLKRLFESKQMTCVIYDSLAPEIEREIFQRVQLGMALTVAEKMQAISSPRATWISSLQEKWVLSDTHGLATILDWDIQRGRDFQNIAQFVYLCEDWPNQTVPTSKKIAGWLEGGEPPREAFKKRVEKVLATMLRIARHARLGKGFRKPHPRVAPVEFIFIGVMLYLIPNISDEQHSDNIYGLRTFLRKRFVDVRNNTKVVKALWHFIDKQMDDANEAGQVAESILASSPASRGRPRRSTAGKKRKYYLEEDDDEDDPTNYAELDAQPSKRRLESQSSRRARP